MLLLPNPFAHEKHGLYGPIQESTIEFVGGVAFALGKTPIAKGWFGVALGTIYAATEVALYLDTRAENQYKQQNQVFTYDVGALYHLYV